MHGYPPGLVIPLSGWLRATGWRPGFFELLEIQEQYPGFLQALDTVEWQRQLVKQQMDADKSDG